MKRPFDIADILTLLSTSVFVLLSFTPISFLRRVSATYVEARKNMAPTVLHEKDKMDLLLFNTCGTNGIWKPARPDQRVVLVPCRVTSEPFANALQIPAIMYVYKMAYLQIFPPTTPPVLKLEFCGFRGIVNQLDIIHHPTWKAWLDSARRIYQQMNTQQKLEDFFRHSRRLSNGSAVVSQDTITLTIPLQTAGMDEEWLSDIQFNLSQFIQQLILPAGQAKDITLVTHLCAPGIACHYTTEQLHAVDRGFKRYNLAVLGPRRLSCTQHFP